LFPKLQQKLFGTKPLKEFLQQSGGFILKDPADRLNAVIKPVISEIDPRSAAAARLIERAENEAGKTHMQHRAGAHSARLERHVQRTAFKRSELLKGVPAREHFGVKRRIVFSGAQIMRACNDPVILHNDSADRHFVLRKCRFSLPKSL
jgi:hypothetical protein